MKGRPGGGRAKSARRKQSGRSKKWKGVPAVTDVTVQMPDGEQLELRGVATDVVADLRMLLRDRTDYCHLTNYGFLHSVRGAVPEDQQVSALKPSELEVVPREYTAESALAHVRNLLEITAGCTMLGPQRELPEPSDKCNSSAAGVCDGLEIVADISDFFCALSLSKSTNPIKEINISEDSASNKGADSLLNMTLTVADGCNPLHVRCAPAGFFLAEAPEHCHHELLDLLKEASAEFSERWSTFMSELDALYPDGNLPFGIVANTWLAPACMADDPSAPRLLPAEDPALGAHNLGCAWGQASGQHNRNWAAEFSNGRKRLRAAKGEEIVAVNRALFLAHCSYLDTAVVEGVKAAAEAAVTLDSNEGGATETSTSLCGFHLEVSQEPLACAPGYGKVYNKQERDSLCVRAVMTGLATFDSVMPATTLDPVVVHHCGRRVKVSACPAGDSDSDPLPAPRPEDEPAFADCGAVCLKLNPLRCFLHSQRGGEGTAGEEELAEAGIRHLQAVLQNSTTALQNSPHIFPPLRSELAVAWAQYLKEPPSEGPGARQGAYGFSHQQQQQQPHHRPSKDPNPPLVVGGGSDKGEEALRQELGEDTWAALAKLDVGLHRLSPEELTSKASEWYLQVALRRAVWELHRLEIAPVDGATLCEFLHSRGINVRHLGRIVSLSREAVSQETSDILRQEALSKELVRRQGQGHPTAGQASLQPHRVPPAGAIPGSMSHVLSVCQLDMVARALKHLLRAVISSAREASEKPHVVAAAIASTLSAALGTSDNDLHKPLWEWLRMYVLKRYAHQLPTARACVSDPQRLLRACCQKVGLEIAARVYSFEQAYPLGASDIVATVPVSKTTAFALMEPRKLLDAAKASMDKGNLEAAAVSATQAVVQLSEVTGAHHRLCAGAYSLLAVVLYHTGDFLQAAYYQKKALIINERHVGLDHGDTLKSYGDLAVFYYRLQRYDLAMKYVLRCTYMLGLACGSAHPNTAATYVNIAMMQEGCGKPSAALRYLHAALKCNTALLGSEHVQTAASYHAMAIALSLMEPPIFSLSVQHEQTCWEILDRQIGPHDIRTQDAAAWLDYFDQKAAEQAKAGSGASTRWSEKSIASKGHLPVKDLMAFIGEVSSGLPSSKSALGPKFVSEAQASSAFEESCIEDEVGSAEGETANVSVDLKDQQAAAGIESGVSSSVKMAPKSPVSVLSEADLEMEGTSVSYTYQEPAASEVSDEHWEEVKTSRNPGKSGRGFRNSRTTELNKSWMHRKGAKEQRQHNLAAKECGPANGFHMQTPGLPSDEASTERSVSALSATAAAETDLTSSHESTAPPAEGTGSTGGTGDASLQDTASGPAPAATSSSVAPQLPIAWEVVYAAVPPPPSAGESCLTEPNPWVCPAVPRLATWLAAYHCHMMPFQAIVTPAAGQKQQQLDPMAAAFFPLMLPFFPPFYHHAMPPPPWMFNPQPHAMPQGPPQAHQFAPLPHGGSGPCPPVVPLPSLPPPPPPPPRPQAPPAEPASPPKPSAPAPAPAPALAPAPATVEMQEDPTGSGQRLLQMLQGSPDTPASPQGVGDQDGVATTHTAAHPVAPPIPSPPDDQRVAPTAAA